MSKAKAANNRPFTISNFVKKKLPGDSISSL